MLDMTRIQAGRLSFQKSACDLTETIANAVNEQRLVSQREILVIGLPSTLPAFVDAQRIWQVITNLLSNAIKYSSAQTPVEVTITTHHVNSRASVRISVRDYGIGIPPEQLTHVFDRFYRTPEVLRGGQEGLGLGLYIARAIVEGHEGSLSVSSEPNIGSVFTLEIPLDRSVSCT
jgi:signal transduction histidine kinase